MTDSGFRKPGAVAAWCVYDWANSAFPTVIGTFVFSAYFTQGVAADPVAGTAQWSRAVTVSAVLIALLSPIFGAIADAAGRQKPWLAVFTVVCALASGALWFVKPDPSWALFALIAFTLANAAFEFATVFYNAMLPELVAPARLGRVSGWGWGLGYAGGLVCLLLVLYGFVQPETPLFGLDKSSAEHVRASGPIAGIWYALFAIPLFLFVPDGARSALSIPEAVRAGLSTLWKSFQNVRHYKNIVTYLIARMLYTDGLNTMFLFGGIYAAGTFGMPISEVIVFGIALNVTAGLGAAGFAWIDDWIGAKKTILIALVALTFIGLGMVITDTKAVFWGLGMALGTFFGPAQAASRSLMARLAPAEVRTEMFGLYALSGKATAFLGPLVLGIVAETTGSQRAGMATVLVFLIVGGVMLLAVREPDA